MAFCCGGGGGEVVCFSRWKLFIIITVHNYILHSLHEVGSLMCYTQIFRTYTDV